MPMPRSGDHLSQQQKRVLAGAAQGMLRWEIADMLHISEHTVRNHLHDIHRRLEARNTTHAVALALARGLITFQE